MNESPSRPTMTNSLKLLLCTPHSSVNDGRAFITTSSKLPQLLYIFCSILCKTSCACHALLYVVVVKVLQEGNEVPSNLVRIIEVGGLREEILRSGCMGIFSDFPIGARPPAEAHSSPSIPPRPR